jgi:signal peptidase I
MERLFNSVQYWTERYLTRRKRKRAYAKAKQEAKNTLVDWLEAFLWAVVVVLIINQYLAQAYVIPSGSMKDTLQLQDRIFVNKLIYGPELVPGALKVSGFTTPERNEVVIFENPTYISKGPLFDTLQRIIYMLTFSMVDIDQTAEGEPKPHFLIKRAVGTGGDRLQFRKGELYMRPPGFGSWMHEERFRELAGFPDPSRRIIEASAYAGFRAHAQADAYRSQGLPVPSRMRRESAEMQGAVDSFAWMKYRTASLYAINPHERRFGSNWRRFETGWYVPQGWIFPLGDNRDNSRDARYFGPVKLDNVLGRAMFKYWPPGRIGPIR